MLSRRCIASALALVLWVGIAPAAQIQTRNFLVTAPDEQIARQFGQMAEVYRRQKAIDWLGAEMPPWTAPCPLTVKPTMGGSGGGATSFNYDRGSYQIISMNIEGPMERMLNSVLPHEVTHTIFAHHFRAPMPRWADEGGAVLSEDELERGRHDQLCRNFLNSQQKVSLRKLLNVREYHEVDNVMKIYAQGYSVSNYLVGLSDRPTFLNFVATGMRNGWDKATQTYYRMNSVEELEEAWLQHLRATRDTARGAAVMMAANPNSGSANAMAMSREVVRLTAPPAQPELDPAGPVYRGQSGDDRWSNRPGYLPPPAPPGVIPLGSTPRSTSSPARPTQQTPPVMLGLPESAPAALAAPLREGGPSPIGFQH